MKRLKVFGALLSAAAMALSMPLTALAGTATEKVETISTTGWVEVSNALPQKGDVISMTISLDKTTQIKGISGWMRSVVGATPVLGPESTAAPAPTATPTAAAAPSKDPAVTENPALDATAGATDATTESPSPTQTPSATSEQDDQPQSTPTESQGEDQADNNGPEQGEENTEPGDDQNPGENTPDEDEASQGGDESASENGNSEESDEPGEDNEANPAENGQDEEPSREEDGETPLERDPDNGWQGLLSDDDLFIVIGEAAETNSAIRYFQITGEPGATVRFEFSGRYSDGQGDHLFVATHEFQISQGTSKVSNQLKMSTTGTVRTVDGSNLQFRVWPEMTTIEGIRAATMKTKGTSAGELLRNLKMPSRTAARVYRSDTTTPRLGAVCTGDTVRFTSSARGAATEATAVVRGDILGTGKLGLNQLVAMSKTLSGQLPLDEAGLQAADVNGDGKVTPADATVLKKLVLGRS